MSRANQIYLDNASTTAPDRRVIEAMRPYLASCYGNPSSIHSFGVHAREALEKFRHQMAQLLHAHSHEVIFTSGGTEANNLALKGVAYANRAKGNHILVSAIEHDSILNACKWLETQGFLITYLPVNPEGIVDTGRLAQLITPKTILVSVMHANNETGTVQPLDRIGMICRERGVPLHSDACQSFGKIPVNPIAQHLSLLSLNAHKMYGPKGVGCLYVRDGVRIAPLLHGGGQEFGVRSTTENLAAIAGFVAAGQICLQEMAGERERLLALRQHIIDTLQRQYPNFYLNGAPTQCLPHIVNFSLSGLEGETIRLLLLLDQQGIAVSTGSACSNNDTTKSASHVLQAMQRNPFEARGAIRVSLGRYNTAEEIDCFLDEFARKVNLLNPIFS